MAKEAKKGNGNGIGFLDSIKTKLILIMILIAAVPLAVAVIVSYNTSTSKALADAADSAEWEVWYFEGRFENICTSNMNMIQSIASNPVVVQYITGDTSVSYEEVQDIIRECDKVLDDGDQTSIAGPDGFQIVRTSGDFIDVSDRAYFQEAMKGNSYISDLTVSKTSGKRMISFSTPVYDDNNNIIAVVHRNYNINNFHEILASDTDSAFMIDRSGKLCAHAAYEIGEGAHDEVDMSNLDVFNNDESEGFYLEPNYDNNYIAFARDSNTGFIVCTSKTEENVLGAARQSAVIVL